ncbi:MAG TPA: MBL fold metallo-hydrolase [Acidobacteriaceae bacterium]|jgi:phosphoribosyl 1,2-cyclic phosphodiesterase|nr:MBL fold metallo-hydrolase [Acidobacteriaceae bacterium]
MVRMTVLASGSKGNSTVVASATTRILVDAGLSCRELMKRMKAAGEDSSTLDAILITHEHQDHVQGLAVTARKLGIPVYWTEPTHRAWVRWMTPRKRITYAQWLEKQKQEAELRAQSEASDGRAVGEKPADGPREATPSAASPTATEPDAEELAAAEEALTEAAREPEKDSTFLPVVQYFCSGSGFHIGDIAITPFTIPHDAIDPVGFVFEAEGVRIGLATDLGYMPSNVSVQLRGCDVLMLESNHDLEMLREGPYPWSVKQRVMSRVGHLSNEATAEFLARGYDGQAAYVVLAHLSENNNLPELARIAAERALHDRMSLLANRLLLAEQDRPMETISLR